MLDTNSASQYLQNLSVRGWYYEFRTQPLYSHYKVYLLEQRDIFAYYPKHTGAEEIVKPAITSCNVSTAAMEPYNCAPVSPTPSIVTSTAGEATRASKVNTRTPAPINITASSLPGIQKAPVGSTTFTGSSPAYTYGFADGFGSFCVHLPKRS